MTGTERMYGVARFLADYYDLYHRAGVPITADVQRAAQVAVCDWLQAHPLREPHVTFRLPDEEEQPAAHG